MMRRRFASIICEAASRVLPSSRRQWGDAMIADLGYVDDDDEALTYATGCLLAAFVERFRDFDTRFAAGLWSVAVVTGLFAMIHVVCAAHGVRVLLGAPDAMLDALRQSGGMNDVVVARFESARPVVIGCFFILGFMHAAAGWFLIRAEFKRFLFAWCAALLVAVVAVAIQLSVIWTADGVPSEFYALLVQGAAIPSLLIWSNGRHRRLEKMQ